MGKEQKSKKQAWEDEGGQEWTEGWDEVIRTGTKMRHKHRLTYISSNGSALLRGLLTTARAKGKANSKALSGGCHMWTHFPNLASPLTKSALFLQQRNNFDLQENDYKDGSWAARQVAESVISQ